MTITNERIARVLGVPASRVDLYWPKIEECLTALCKDQYTDEVRIAALATIRVECPPFAPIHEYGSDEAHEKIYGGRQDLGNLNAGDGARYAGRGFIQITGEFNYAKYGKLLGIDLIDDPADPNDDDDPNKALEPDAAAAIFAAYFHDSRCDIAANAHDWTRVRQIVNGGKYGHSNGLKAFLVVVQMLALEAGRPDLAETAQQHLRAAGVTAKAAGV